MGRLSAAIGRIIQSVVQPWEMQSQVYIDDILGVLAGPIELRQKLLSLVLYTLGAFGVNVSPGKGERGRRLRWIGVTYDLDYPNQVVLGIPQKMVDEIKMLLQMVAGRARHGRSKRTALLCGQAELDGGSRPTDEMDRQRGLRHIGGS